VEAEKPLRALLEGEPLMPDRAIELLCQLAEHLAALHEKGGAYRALKPENILVSATPTGERARLVELPPPATEGATVMVEAIPQGPYTAPEQASGAPPDARGDIFAFGAVGYELLSGIPPAGAPLAEAAPHLVDNKKLLDLVTRCLEADPAKRPLTARELALKLGRVPQVGEPTILMEALSMMPPALPKRAPKPPPLPPAGVLPPPPGVPVPKPLLNSVIMPSPSQLGPAEQSPLMDAPKPLAPPAAPRIRVLAVAGAGALAALAIAGLMMTAKKTPAQEARALLEAGKPKEAIELLKVEIQQNQKRSDPTVLAMVAVAMHQLDQHRDEEKVFKDEIAPKAPELLDAFVLGGLLEDLGKNEAGPSRELLKRIPKEPLYTVVKPIAQGDRSAKQWGALRYLDLESASSELDLPKLYVAALDDPSCSVKRTAAKRLGQLGDKLAEESLTKLKGEPKGEEPCGQSEASAALAAIKKKAEAPPKTE
jgi:eukaryotic-like serine/threonine-protein kinase